MSEVSRAHRDKVDGRNVQPSWLMTYNKDAQEHLLQSFCWAFEEGHYSLAGVAEDIGTTPDVIEAALSGGADLNLTEMRHLAFSLNCIVEFRVTRAVDFESEMKTTETLRGIEAALWERLPGSDEAEGNPFRQYIHGRLPAAS